MKEVKYMKSFRVDKNGRTWARVAVWHRRRDGVRYCRHVWTCIG